MTTVLHFFRSTMAYFLIVIVCYGIISTAFYKFPNDGLKTIVPLVLVGCIFVYVSFSRSEFILNSIAKLSQYFGALEAKKFWLLAAGVGVLIRLAWLFLFPQVAMSGDGLVNKMIVDSLIAGGPFIAETSFGTYRGLYPPGFPLFLSTIFWFTGQTEFNTFLVQSALCAAACVLLFHLLRPRVGTGSARLSTLVFILLPNLFMLSRLPLKEPLIITLLLIFLVCYSRSFSADKQAKAFLFCAIAGAAFGYAILTQPSLALFLGVLIVCELLFFKAPKPFLRLCCILLATFAVLAPWSIRQSLLFDKFVPLTTGSGWALYTSNNEFSYGGFTMIEQIIPEYESIDERDFSGIATERAVTFIKNNPVDFLELVIRRQLEQLSCLDYAAINGMRQSGQIFGPMLWAAQALCGLFWICILCSIIAGRRGVIDAIKNDPVVFLATLLPLYTFVIHSIFEGGSRHMVMHFGSWLLLFALATQRSQSVPTSQSH